MPASPWSVCSRIRRITASKGSSTWRPRASRRRCTTPRCRTSWPRSRPSRPIATPDGSPGAPGYLVGWSAGAAIAAAIEIVRREPDAYVVAVGCDTGARYLSEPHRWEGA